MTGLDWRTWTPTNGPWTTAEGVSPLRAEAAQGVGSLQSHPSSPGQNNHNPYFPPLPEDPQPQAGSPLGAHQLDQQDGLPRRAGSRLSPMDARGFLPAPRQPLHHSASDPQLHHARARAAVSAASIGVGMYSPLSRQHWLPHDITETGARMEMPLGMGMGINRVGMEIGMESIVAMGSHLDSGLGLHPRPPSTEVDGDESGSGSDPGMDATSRMSGELNANAMSEMEMAMHADMALSGSDMGMNGTNDMGLSAGDMNAQRAMNGMTNGVEWQPLELLLHPPTGGPHPIPRWSSGVESLEDFTPETAGERQDYFRQTGEDTTRRFPGTHLGSLHASGRMTLGLEMPTGEPTHDPRLADLRSWNYAQPGHHQMMIPPHLHPAAFRPMASPPLSGGGSPRPSFDLRLSAASGMAPGGYQGLPPSGLEPGRARYMSEVGRYPGEPARFQSTETGRYPDEGARFPHHPLHPQQPWDGGMMTVSNGLGLGSGSAREGSSGMTPPPLQVLRADGQRSFQDEPTTGFSTDEMHHLEFQDERQILDTGAGYEQPERAYPTPLSAHPRLPVTGEGSASGSEVKFEHPSPRLLPLPE